MEPDVGVAAGGNYDPRVGDGGSILPGAVHGDGGAVYLDHRDGHSLAAIVLGADRHGIAAHIVLHPEHPLGAEINAQLRNAHVRGSGPLARADTDLLLAESDPDAALARGVRAGAAQTEADVLGVPSGSRAALHTDLTAVGGHRAVLKGGVDADGADGAPLQHDGGTLGIAVLDGKGGIILLVGVGNDLLLDLLTGRLGARDGQLSHIRPRRRLPGAPVKGRLGVGLGSRLGELPRGGRGGGGGSLPVGLVGRRSRGRAGRKAPQHQGRQQKGQDTLFHGSTSILQ